MSGTTRQAARMLSPVQQHLYHLRCRSLLHSTTLPANLPQLVRHSISLQQQQQQPSTHRFLTTTRPVSASHTNPNTTPSSASDPDEKPPTTIQASQITPETFHLDVNMKEDAKSIEQIIAELNQDTRTAQQTSADPSSSSSSSSDSTSAASEDDATTDTIAAAAAAAARARAQKRRSRFWYILYNILYYSALGSIPVHLLLIKGETKALQEKQEWKIGVLTEMRDKLKRGESVVEEEALLSVGLSRSKREEQPVDDKYFEDLLVTAEKLDFAFGKDRDTLTTELDTTAAASSTPSPVSSSPPPPPPQPTTPRKPPPPKTEKSFL